MKQLLQSMKTGKTIIEEVPILSVKPGSVGTERMLVEFGEKNLLQKARSRPGLARQEFLSSFFRALPWLIAKESLNVVWESKVMRK
jgi:hypothetical protein